MFSPLPKSFSRFEKHRDDKAYKPRVDTLTQLRSCVKVEVAVVGSPSLIVLMVSVDVKQL